MNELIQEIGTIFPEKALLTAEDISKALECEVQTIHNWSKRSNPKRRPPRIIVGKEVRFPKKHFLLWFAEEQLRAVI